MTSAGTPQPSVEDLANRFEITAFTRLARAHAFSVAGDAFVAMALAGSLFFSITPDAARAKVALYLILTMAPFAVVGPFIGPAIDRMAGGRRFMVLLTFVARLLAAFAMVSNIKSLWLFPLAFVQLVSSKSYAVAKSALVPTTVANDVELVEANSKLNLLGGVVGFAASVPALPLLGLSHPEMVVSLGVVAFAVGTVLAWQLPKAQVAGAPATADERAELRSAGVVLAASATALLRAVVGFLTFGIAFWFRRTGTATWWFGVVLAFSSIGALTASAVAPIVRRSIREETMVWGVLAVVAATALAAATTGGRVSAAVLAGVVGFGSSIGRLAFDSIVQRDAPDANRGRSFAQFETRFQLVWVAAAFVPVVIPFPGWVAFATIGVTSLAGCLTYVLSLRHLRLRGVLPEPLYLQARRAVGRVDSRFGRMAGAAGRGTSGLPQPSQALEVAAPELPIGDPLPPPPPPSASGRRGSGLDAPTLPFDS